MKNIYIELVEHLGDIIACEPVTRYLRAKNPDAKIFWIVKPQYRDVLVANSNIDGIVEVADMLEADKFCAEKRATGDEIVD